MKFETTGGKMTSNIKSTYRILDCDRIHQGDVLKDFSFIQLLGDIETDNIKNIDFKYLVILSQDCDLEGAKSFQDKLMDKKEGEIINGNKFLPSILVAPLFEDEKLNEGTYLSHLKFKMDNKGSEHRTKWKDIINNNNPRYHYLGNFDENSNNYIVDFKIFYTVPYEYIFKRFEDCYYKSLNELFREDLSNRFFNYQSRIGLPPVDENK